MSTALIPVSDLEKMAAAVASSKLFGVTTSEQAMALMLVAQAEGLHPATAARDYHIIAGRPTLKADAMLARYLASGGKVEWHEHTDSKVAATFTHPQGGSLRIEWDMARAKQAELKSPMWTKYPRQMLRARVISEGVRATNPAVAVGVYTPEEAEDFEPAKRPRKEKDMGAAIVVPETGEVISREAELGALCKEAGFNIKFYLNRAGVEKVDDMTPEDYIAAVENAKQRAAKAKQPTTQT